MDFPGTGCSPGPSPQVRGESRRLRRERDNTKTLSIFSRYPLRGIARRDRTVAEMRSTSGEPPLTLSPFVITCQGPTQAR